MIQSELAWGITLEKNKGLKADFYIFSPEDDDSTLELLLPQFINALARDNFETDTVRSAALRFRSLSIKNYSCVALANGTDEFLGIIFFDYAYNIGEISYPYSVNQKYDKTLIEIATEECVKNKVASLRIERQLIPDYETVTAAAELGYFSQERFRMDNVLNFKNINAIPAISTITFKNANIKYLEALTDLLIKANLFTKDADMFYPILSVKDVCREWLIRVFSGVYGEFLRASKVAFRGNELIGCCLIINLENGIAGIMEISVLPEVSGRGIGTILLAKGLKKLFEDDYIEVDLAVTKGNDKAIKLYKKLGFSTTGEYTVCYKDMLNNG